MVSRLVWNSKPKDSNKMRGEALDFGHGTRITNNGFSALSLGLITFSPKEEGWGEGDETSRPRREESSYRGA